MDTATFNGSGGGAVEGAGVVYVSVGCDYGFRVESEGGAGYAV